MTKLLSGLCAAALVVGLAGAGGVAPAQDKKDTKTPPKTDTKTAPPAKAGTIEVNESKDGKYRFTVRDGEGKYLGGSATGYATKEDAAKAVDALKAALGTAKIEYGKSK